MSSNSDISNSELANAYKIARSHKAFKKTFNKAPPQTKVIISFVIPLLFGFVIYSFINNISIQMIVFAITTGIIGLILYSFIENYAEGWAIIVSFLVGTMFWFYIFYNKYIQQQEDESVGKKSFICEPTGTCNTDGTSGPFDGTKEYRFHPVGGQIEIEQNVIPSNQFDIRNQKQFTYMFWLNINYKEWKKVNGKNKKIILMKGAKISTSDLVVWLSNDDDTIQFDIGTGESSKPISTVVNFPFGQWVHYTIVKNDSVIELYKNATLEKTTVFKNDTSVLRDHSNSLKIQNMY